MSCINTTIEQVPKETFSLFSRSETCSSRRRCCCCVVGSAALLHRARNAAIPLFLFMFDISSSDGPHMLVELVIDFSSTVGHSHFFSLPSLSPLVLLKNCKQIKNRERREKTSYRKSGIVMNISVYEQ